MDVAQITKGKKNFVFIGEAGSGKSEIAVNFAQALCQQRDREVHFFDLDMTKPLFRTRDISNELLRMGIQPHYEQQFMDAPTTTGGVQQFLRSEDCYVVMDVGGDYIGARSIGGYASQLNGENTTVYYVMNSYRPWSTDIQHIDCVLGEILNVSHLSIEKLHLIANPNLGINTCTQDIIDGLEHLDKMVGAYKNFDFVCVWEKLANINASFTKPVLPIKLYLTYPWDVAAM